MSTSIPSAEAQSESSGPLAQPFSSSSLLVAEGTQAVSPYSAIISSIFGGSRDGPGWIVLFVSAETRAGVTRTASAVAGELAASGRKVLLADAAIICSLSETEAFSLCERMGADRIWVLGATQAARIPTDINRQNFRPSTTIYALSREFPYIVLDAPALSNSDVALRLADSVETILVVRRDRTETRAAVRACQRITAAGGRMLGCVYNDY